MKNVLAIKLVDIVAFASTLHPEVINLNFIMKNILFVVFALMVTCCAAFSQTTASIGKIEYQKGQKQAAIIELPYAPEIVEGALRKKFTSALVKEERLKGMQVFKGSRLTPTDGQVADLYFSVEKRGRKESDQSVVYLILGRPNENVALRPADDNYRVKDARDFLNTLKPVVATYDLEVKIKKQDELIKKSERSLEGLTDDQRIYEERLKDLQDKLTQNKKDQEKLTQELQKQRDERNILMSQKVAN